MLIIYRVKAITKVVHLYHFIKPFNVIINNDYVNQLCNFKHHSICSFAN